MQLSLRRARVATSLSALGLAALLAACGDAAPATGPAGDLGPVLRADVTPLALHVKGGTTLRALVSLENRGPAAIDGLATVCLAPAGDVSAPCGPVLAQVSLAKIAGLEARTDTALVNVPLAAGVFVDVPQRVALRACAVSGAGSAAGSCATSATVRVLPNFEQACGATPLAVGDTVVGNGDAGPCTLSSTGERTRMFAVSVRANDTLVVTLDSRGICGSGVAVFDADGEIARAGAVCGPPRTIEVPVEVGGTYHIAVGSVPAGFVLTTRFGNAPLTDGPPLP